jgi:uncharacterized coiled-coil DUF342 family protein
MNQIQLSQIDQEIQDLQNQRDDTIAQASQVANMFNNTSNQGDIYNQNEDELMPEDYILIQNPLS